jgi:hypothetical protein
MLLYGYVTWLKEIYSQFIFLEFLEFLALTFCIPLQMKDTLKAKIKGQCTALRSNQYSMSVISYSERWVYCTLLVYVLTLLMATDLDLENNISVGGGC